jgi:vitamin B12 transporter
MRYSDGLDNDEFLNRGAVIKAGYSDNRTQAGVLFFVNLAESGIPFYMGVPTPNRRYTQDNYLVGLPLQFNLKGGIVRMRLSHQTNRYKFDDPDDAWSPYYVNSSWVNGAEIQFETTLFSRLRLQAGFDRAAHRILNEVEDGQVVNEEKTNITSIFINTGLDLRRLTLAASVRYDKYKHLDAALSPQLGLALMAADWLRLRASLGRSFRAPTLPELFNPAWGNPHLEPERGTSWEIGAEVYTGPAVLSLVYFDSAYDHLIGYDPVNWIFVNIDQADISGIEIGARFKLWQTVQAHAAYTHLNTHDVKNDQELLRRPRHALSLMLTYTNRHFAVSAEMRYVGRRLDYDELLWATGESPAFDTYNFSLQVPVNRKLSLVGRATNAFDRSYEEILGYPAPGRRFLLGVRYKFL